HTGLPAIADDSGIEVDFLKGQPGIYSSRFAGSAGDDEANNSKLLHLLQDVPHEQRTARFQCLMVYMRHAQDPTPVICQGTWEGFICEKASGTNGFGYDPLFFVPDHNCCAAELDSAEKNRISHRGQALIQLGKYFQQLK
ncbi:MAG: non-canonical purine NTP pyrophosphatase, partial [Gammaproteobacteria bacterium]|nr:non-canonical purine NTP pyrophosphatase [Gammaproteobacteria bacterium]